MSATAEAIDLQGLHLAWREAWRASPDEETYEVTDVEGELPRELCGTLYRNGPSQRVLPHEGYGALHLFDGDGLVHAFRFDDGRLHYTGRFVRNASFRFEEAAGPSRQDFLGFRVADPAPDAPMRVQPNTNVVFHGGRLLALVENGVPFELDPRTLASLGERPPCQPMLGMSTSAHPKIDGRTGQAFLHGYQPVPPYVQYYVLERDGTCSLAETIDTPYAVMMHDLAITEHHVVFLLCPMLFELDPERSFRDWIRWAPEKGLRFGVRSRAAGGAVRWFEAPTPGFMFHPGNAYEDEGRIVMDACTYLDGDALLEQLACFRAGRTVPRAGAVPFLYELDLATGACTERQLSDRGAEFPRLDDRRVGYPNRWGYAVVGEPDALRPGPKAILKYDRTTGRSVAHELPPRHYPSEPVFVPRTSDAAEDDGFVLIVVYDGTTGLGYVAVLDARNLERAPLARAQLRHRIPMGFHGNFAPGVV
jgi:carotenoid cleavage dioxygenase